MLEDTVIAISTPLGFGGLGIVRLSGRKSLSIAKKIFRPKKKRRDISPRHPVLGNLYDPEHRELFEEAYLTYFPKPHTYTREDLVEITCHGSPVVLEEVVRLGIRSGARHANPGEFTLRAYLNGRIDILQAEAINDLITASSLCQAKISYKQLEGSLTKKITSFRQKIIRLLSQVEASIEFPDEGLKVSSGSIRQTLENVCDRVERLIASYDLGKILTEGLTLAITGRTNVGKSTLFNALLEKDRAIVTPYPGTTRDFLREKIKIKDALFTLTDMAGMDRPFHAVEREGIKRGKQLASEADGILHVLDASRKETREDAKLIEKFREKKTLLLFNKRDLPLKMDLEKMKNMGKDLPALEISALKKTNLEKLKIKIHEIFIPAQPQNDEVVLHLRQKLLLEEILRFLSQAKSLLERGYPDEIYAEEIRKTIPLIGQLTGEIQSEDIIEDIFSRFCVGK
jgi:tRNA modification GTPase